MRITGITNLKGGVAKTTSAAALADALKAKGHSVLLIDLDVQGTLTSMMNAKSADADCFDLLIDHQPLASCITHTDRCDIVAGGASLAMIELKAMQKYEGSESKVVGMLKTALHDADQLGYEFCIVDCPPSGVLTMNALLACNDIIVPLVPDVASLEGLKELMKTISSVKAGMNPGLQIAGLLITMTSKNGVDAGLIPAINISANAANVPVFNTMIPRSADAKKAALQKVPVISLKNSKVGAAYMALTEEYLNQ